MRHLWVIVFVLFCTLAAANKKCDPSCNLKQAICRGGECLCRDSYIGATCDIFVFDAVPGLFTLYRALFSIVFTVFLVLSIACVIRAFLSKNKANSGYHKAGFALLTICCIVQIFVYSVHPETIPGDHWIRTATFLQAAFFIILYLIYAVYLSMWIDINEQSRNLRKGVEMAVQKQRENAKRIYPYGNAQDLSNSSFSISATPSGGGSTGTGSDTASHSAGSSNVIVMATPYTGALPSSLQTPDGKTEEGSLGSKGGVRICADGISGRTMKVVLMVNCIAVVCATSIRTGLSTSQVDFFITTMQCGVVVIVAWLWIVASFQLYKRSFLRQLKESATRDKTMKNVRKVTRNTWIVTGILFSYFILVIITFMAMGTATLLLNSFGRGCVTSALMVLFLHCFGGESIRILFDGALKRIKGVFNIL